MRPHGGVDATGQGGVLQHLAVHALAHTVQTLQLELAAAARRHLQDGGNGGGIVGGELRVDGIRRVQQQPGAGQVGHIGVLLVREHRVAGQAQLLGAFDFGVPIGALDQAAHQAQLVFARRGRQVLDQLQRTGLVGLQGQAKAGPLRAMPGHTLQQGIQHLQRQFQPVHLLGVNGEVDVGAGRLLAQAPDARHQLGQHAPALRILVARMQGAELDGNAVVALGRAAGIAMAGNKFNRVAIAFQVAQGIGIGARTLTQHVIGIGEPPRSLTSCSRCPPRGLLCLGAARRHNGRPVLLARGIGLLHRLRHVLAQHKLAAQQLHGAQGSGDHGAGTQLGHDAGLGLRVGQEVLGQGNRRAGKARQQLVAAVDKVGPTELVGRQGDGGFGIGHAQQGFGQAHQGQALGAGNGVLAQQAFHGPERRRVVAHRPHPGCGRAGRCGPVQTGAENLQLSRNDLTLGTVGNRQAGLNQHSYLLGIAKIPIFRFLTTNS